jgi:hypothetical protein
MMILSDQLLATPSHHRLVTKKCPPCAHHNSRLKVWPVIDPSSFDDDPSSIDDHFRRGGEPARPSTT